MADAPKYRFRIGAYSPKTMPLGRLLEYLTHFKRMFDNPDKIHLIGIESGSTAPAFHVEPSFEQDFIVQAEKVASGLGNEIQNEAYRQVRYLAGEDKAKGTVIESPSGAEIIPFPVAERPAMLEQGRLVIEGIEESATIFASLYKIGRKDSKSKKYDAWFSDLKNGNRINAEMSMELGIKMGKYMETELSISGIATWNRNQDGEWIIHKLVVNSFDEFQPKDRGETFAKIRELKDSLPEDIHERLNTHRSGDE